VYVLKDINSYGGLYAVDHYGHVWSLKHTSSRREGLKKPYVNTGGYLRVNLYDEQGRAKKHYVHRLVAQTFLPNPEGYPAVNHISANKSDNSLSNLEWCDAKYNIAESRRLGLQKDMRVSAFSVNTGESRSYKRLKDAATDLADKPWAFNFLRKKQGNNFNFCEWRIEVMPT